jgi:D-threo-aldose 1-dehydrogenase
MAEIAEDVTSRLGYGAAGIGNHLHAVSDEEAQILLETAWASGIRLFDTAPHYGLGLSERRLGAFLRDKPREDYQVSTKVGRLLVEWPEHGTALDDEGFVVPATHRRVWDFSADGVARSVEESLGRLGLDRVDVLYLHDPERHDLDVGLAEGLPALARMREAGVIRRVGVGSMDHRALLGAARSGIADELMVAGRYTLADLAAEVDVLPACSRHSVEVVAAAVFNGGLLASTPAPSSTFDYRTVPRDVLRRAQALHEVCAKHAVPLRAAALQFPLRHPVVTRVVAGGVTPGQVRENARLIATPLPEAFWADIEMVPV